MTKKEKKSPYMESHVTITEKAESLFIWKCHLAMTKKDAYVGEELQL